MTGYDGYDALLYFFAHIAREDKGKEIGVRVICVMDFNVSPVAKPHRIMDAPRKALEVPYAKRWPDSNAEGA